MSSTTVEITNGTLLEDYGNIYGNGTGDAQPDRIPRSEVRRHSVFGAGTVQWAFGLGVVHADVATNQDPVMEQATINLFADMGTQPGTLQSDLVAATESPVTTGPTAYGEHPAPQRLDRRSCHR